MAAPPRKNTIEVQAAWLEPEEAPSSKARPPRLPGAARTLPPMPVPTQTKPPPRRATMEVDMNWLELIPARAEEKEPQPASETRAKKPLPKPLKREEE